LAFPLALAWVARHWVGRDALPWTTQFTENVMVGADPLTARLTALMVVGLQLLQMLWPARLCSDYSIAETTLFDWAPQHWMLVLLACVSVIAIVPLYRRSKAAAFYLGFFWITLLPTSNLIFRIASARADRFLYLPLVGIAGISAVVAPTLNRRLSL